VGRFLSVDPVTASSINGGNFNRYWYANNNPYKFMDPDGRKARPPRDNRSICAGQETRCGGRISSGSGNGETKKQADGRGAAPIPEMELTRENAQERLNMASAELEKRVGIITMASFGSKLEAAEWFVSFAQDITNATGVEIGATIVEDGQFFSLENVNVGSTWQRGTNVLVAPPGGRSGSTDIHSHHRNGATNAFWHSPFSESDMSYYGAPFSAMVTLPDGAIFYLETDMRSSERVR
jgi:hypothetical protein